MKKKGKVIALILVIAIVFGIWKGPISSRAEKNNNKTKENIEKTNNNEDDKIEIPEEEVVENFVIQAEDESYFEYKITSTDVYCVYYEYIGEDANGNKQYEENVTKMGILSEALVNELINNQDNSENEDYAERSNIQYRNGTTKSSEGNPLYWQKITRDKLKKQYYYQSGVKGEDIYYRIGGEQSFAVNYSKLSLEAQADIDKFIDQLNLVNKELTECLICAIGTVMLAISAIIASYVSVGAAKCLSIVAPLLQKFGVTLLSITPVGFGKLVFKTYEDYLELEPVFLKAATYGSIFTM